MGARGLAVVFAVVALGLGAFVAYDQLDSGGGSAGDGTAATAEQALVDLAVVNVMVPAATQWLALPLERKYEICEGALRSYADADLKVYAQNYYTTCLQCGPAAAYPVGTPVAGLLLAGWSCPQP